MRQKKPDMKKIGYSLLIFVFSTGLLQAQKAEVGFTMSLLSDNSVDRFSSYMDDANYSVGKSFSVGFTFLKPLNNWLDLETGIEYFRGNVSVSSLIPAYNGFIAVYQNSPILLINIPVGMRANFWKYCFVNGGFLFDMDVSKDSPIDSQIGLGSLLGVGLKYNFKTGISVFINPYMKVHALIPETFDNYKLHLLESAIRFGVTYQL